LDIISQNDEQEEWGDTHETNIFLHKKCLPWWQAWKECAVAII
jgi:hypothetical protein